MPRLKSLTGYITIGALLLSGLYSAIHTPLVADDFGIALSQANKVNESWMHQIHLSFVDFKSGTHFNLIGAFISHFYVKFWLGFSSQFNLNLHWIFWALKFLCFIFASEVCSRFVKELIRVDFLKIRIVVAIIFFSFIQIHTPWSNDPVTNFTLSGFFSAPFAFIALLCVIQRYQSPTIKNLLLCFGLNFLAILVYELNVAIIAAEVVFLLFVLSKTPNSGFFLFPITLTGLLVIFFKLNFAASASSYGGTTVEIGEKVVGTLGLNIASSFPGLGWAASVRLIRFPHLGSMQLALIFFVACVSFLVLRYIAQEPEQIVRTSLKVPVVALASLAFFALFIQALTPKIQSETSKLGYVYTGYAVAYMVSVIFLTLLFFKLSQNRKVFLIYFIVIFGFIQGYLNMGLHNWLYQNLQPNLSLVNLATLPDSTNSERCIALNNWTAGPWPDYYETQVKEGLDEYAALKGKKEFCEL
jgi:hypothetical protein